MKNKLQNIEKAAQRKLAIEQGAMDGRYRIRIVPNELHIS
jgi:hypothetical protein